jgi:hypothetical protein
MKTMRMIPVMLVAGTLAAFGASVAWAVSAAGGKSWQPPAASAWMMGYPPSGQASPVTGIADARQRAQVFADRLGLRLGEVMQFERNYYVKLVDAKGAGATEVLVDAASGAVSLEYGPAMMWNTKYGMMSGRLGVGAVGGMMGSYGAQMMNGYGGMMGRSGGVTSGGIGHGMMGGLGGMMGGTTATPAVPVQPVTPTGTPGVTLEKAHTLAQAWLDANEPGVRVETGGDAFPGYFTLETLRDGKIVGMISVNAYTGVVWSHWWHGAFVARSE